MTLAARRRRKQEKEQRLEGNDGQRKLEQQVATLNFKGEALNDLFLTMVGRLGILCSVFGGLLLYNAFTEGRVVAPSAVAHDGLTVVIGVFVKIVGSTLYSGDPKSTTYMTVGAVCAAAQAALCVAHVFFKLDASSGHRYIPIGAAFFLCFVGSNLVMDSLRKTNEQSWDRLAEMKDAMKKDKKKGKAE